MVFFFFKQKTAYEMRISDWSSDVCSSDLRADGVRRAPPVRRFWAKMLGPVGVASPDRKIAHARAAADPGQPEIEEARFPEAEHHARDMNDQRADPRPYRVEDKENFGRKDRTEERSVGKKGVRAVKSRWAP